VSVRRRSHQYSFTVNRISYDDTRNFVDCRWQVDVLVLRLAFPVPSAIYGALSVCTPFPDNENGI